MTTIENTRLLLMRVQKAVGLIKHLREENKELQTRFMLVENHNKELQDLYDKLSTDQAAIDQAIASALDELDTTLGDLEGFEDFGTLDSQELSEAEDFSAGLDAEDMDIETTSPPDSMPRIWTSRHSRTKISEIFIPVDVGLLRQPHFSFKPPLRMENPAGGRQQPPAGHRFRRRTGCPSTSESARTTCP